MKKRLTIGLIVGATVFAAVFAAAATLGVTSDDLAAGNDPDGVLSCDTDGVDVSYTTTYTATAPAGYKVEKVTIGDIANACNAQSISVTLTGASDTKLETKTGTVAVNSATPDTSDEFDFSGTSVPAANVTGVHVVIAGTTVTPAP